VQPFILEEIAASVCIFFLVKRAWVEPRD
jgi:hypothetical protein